MADDQVATIKQASDIVEVIGEYVKLARTGRTYKGLCPFHDDHHPSMDVDPQRQRFRCWVCGKYGDVITFVQERERVDFVEALELLAKRANITLRRGRKSEGPGRTDMLELMKWAEQQYHGYLLDAEAAAVAREYLESRRLSVETIKKYGLGFAPGAWEWLTLRAQKAGWSQELLEKVGLCGRRERDHSLYDRFRERIMFPIRDVRGRTVGFGGRILPTSSSSADAPKYYNSADTPLFTKSEHLYGLDQARDAGEKAGYLAVVEGYTDVLMAHQMGLLPVVATLGTALNSRHVQQLRRFVPRVVLVFDADAGGEGGVDRALEFFVSHEVELSVATLPVGLDPCDYLLQEGPVAFREVLEAAPSVLDFKLARLFPEGKQLTIEENLRAIDAVMQVVARAPNADFERLSRGGGAPSKFFQSRAEMKRDLVVNQVAHRAGIDERLVGKRLAELRPKAGDSRAESSPPDKAAEEEARRLPADPAERELLEILLAEPGLLARVRERLADEDIRHPGLRRLWDEMNALVEAGLEPSADLLRTRLTDKPRLADAVLRLQAAGQANPQRAAWLDNLLLVFQQRRVASQVTELRSQLRTIPKDGPVPVELLRRLQEQAVGPTGAYGHD